MVSDEEIVEALESLLRDSNNPNYTTTFASLNAVVHHLHSKLGLNLSHKIDFIRSQIHHFLLHQYQPQNFHPHHLQQPTFHPAISPRLPPNFTLQNLPEDYNGIRPPPPPHPQQQQQPPPQDLVKTATSVAVSVAPKKSAPTGRKRRGGPGGLNKICGVSPELQTIVGQPALSRTEIVKQLWSYIRKNNLQDPNNRRKIICNAELQLVFETDCTDMFKMNKLLAKHITPLEPTRGADQSMKKQKLDVEYGSKIDDPVPIVIISEALANFFGTDEREMSQAEVLRQIWEYIKVNQLEDPSNSTAILCDAKLQQLLSCESISALKVPEMLEQQHLFKRS